MDSMNLTCPFFTLSFSPYPLYGIMGQDKCQSSFNKYTDGRQDYKMARFIEGDDEEYQENVGVGCWAPPVLALGLFSFFSLK